MSAAARAPDHGDVADRLRARALRREPDRQLRAALRRRGARRREAEPDPQRQRPRRAGAKLPIPVSAPSRGAGAPRPARLRAAHLALAPAVAQGRDALGDAVARARAGRRLGRGARSSRGWAWRSETAANQTRSRRTLPGSRRSRRAFVLVPGQCGAVLALGDDSALDGVSQPDAFALLWPKLRAGYLLDALERLDGRATSVERIAGFVDDVGAAQATRGPSAGLGQDVRLRGRGVVGSGLEPTARRSSCRRSRAKTAAHGRSAGSHGQVPDVDGSARERVSSRGLDTRRPSRPSLGFASSTRAARPDRADVVDPGRTTGAAHPGGGALQRERHVDRRRGRVRARRRDAGQQRPENNGRAEDRRRRRRCRGGRRRPFAS